MKSILTNTECQKAKPQAKRYKLYDSNGLYLEVKPNGSKLWRFKYLFLKKEKLLALGAYPIVTLAEAREARDNAKKLLSKGIDPSQAKKETKRQAIINSENTFEIVAREWHVNQIEKWSVSHANDVIKNLEKNVFPSLGARPIGEIDAQELLRVLKKLENRNVFHLPGRLRNICGQIFRYGIATGRGSRDHAADLKGALKTRKTKHYATLTLDEMPPFLMAIETNEARLHNRTRRALKLLVLTFVRTVELIEAKWNEFDFENAVWEIPGERMKKENPHIVPLSKQAIELLKEQKAEVGHINTDWVFPNQVRPQKPMSNNTILKAIAALNYKGKQTGHGFRAFAMSTLKEHLGYRHEVVDRQLAHEHKDKINRAYDRAKFLPERVTMMQKWADYVDDVRNSKYKKFTSQAEPETAPLSK